MIAAVNGWTCDCSGTDWHAEGAQWCPRRRPVVAHVDTYPAWRMPAGLSAAGRSVAGVDNGEDGDEAAPGRSPIVTCSSVPDEVDLPTAIGRLHVRLLQVAPGAHLTYAKGWGRRKVVVGRAPVEDGGEEIKAFVPWPVESVVLRSGVLALAWVRQQDQGAWKSIGGYAVWGSRIHPVKITEAKALLGWMEERR
jgi:hypothetical protein